MTNTFKPPCDEGVIRSGSVAVPCPPSADPWILAATILGSSMAFIDGTVVNVALPALQRDLNATVVDVQWVVESYALFLSALLLVGGSLGDRFGRRLIYAIGIGVFAIASAWCALSPSVMQLILARGLQGIGGALLVPGSLAIISASFSEDRRGSAIGTWSGFTSITMAIGPVMGGWLVEHISWRAAFYINIPLAVVVLIILFWQVPESRENREHSKLDWWGAVLVTAGLGSLVYGLIESSHRGFGDLIVIASIFIGIILLAVFLFVEARTDDPMLPLGLFRNRNFRSANLLTMFLYAALSGALFFFPLNLIQVQNYSATAAGAALLPSIFIMFLFSRWSGGLIESYGPRIPLTVGPLIAALGFVLFALPGISGNYWTGFFPANVVLGFGMAITVAPLTTTVMNSVSRTQAGIASGINNAVSRTAGLLAIAIFGIAMLRIFNHRFDEHLANIRTTNDVQQALNQERVKLAAIRIPAGVEPGTREKLQHAVKESFVFAFRRIMFIGAGLSLASALVSWRSIDKK